MSSPEDPQYNCIAWAADDKTRWWWPSPYPTAYWPPGVPRATTLEAFIAAFGTLGYERCQHPTFEAGVEKVAIYIDASGTPTHAARQQEDGSWTSKCGQSYDIVHEPHALDGEAYGSVGAILSRPFD